MTVPHPVNGVLYLKLRDDPATVQTLTLPVTQVSPAESKAAAAQSQPAAAPPPTSPWLRRRRTIGTTYSQDAKPEAPPNARRASHDSKDESTPDVKDAVKFLALVEIGLVHLGEMRLVRWQFVERKNRILRADGCAVAAVDALIGVDEYLRHGPGSRIAAMGAIAAVEHSSTQTKSFVHASVTT